MIIIDRIKGKLFGYEFKWNPNRKVKIPGAWKKEYKNAEFKVIHQDNYLDWVMNR